MVVGSEEGVAVLGGALEVVDRLDIDIEVELNIELELVMLVEAPFGSALTCSPLAFRKTPSPFRQHARLSVS